MTFFNPPRRIETTIFTRLPDQFRKPRRTAWADANQGGREHRLLPRRAVLRSARAGCTSPTFPYGRIFRVSAEGTWELVSEYDGWPNGLKIHRDGRVFITDYKRGIMLLDPASGTVTPFLETAASESFKGVNDLVFAPSGNLYFTDQGQTGMHDPTGRVWKLTPDGRLTCLVNTIPSPNGIVVDAEESFLLVAVTRANQIWRVPLPTSGLTTKVGIFSHLHGGPGGPDGLALDNGGNLLVCHTGFGSIWRLSPVAEPLDRIVSCAGVGTTNLAFGGPERKSLFITESRTGTLLRAELETPGLPMFSHAG